LIAAIQNIEVLLRLGEQPKKGLLVRVNQVIQGVKQPISDMVNGLMTAQSKKAMPLDLVCDLTEFRSKSLQKRVGQQPNRPEPLPLCSRTVILAKEVRHIPSFYQSSWEKCRCQQNSLPLVLLFKKDWLARFKMSVMAFFYGGVFFREDEKATGYVQVLSQKRTFFSWVGDLIFHEGEI